MTCFHQFHVKTNVIYTVFLFYLPVKLRKLMVFVVPIITKPISALRPPLLFLFAPFIYHYAP